MKIVFVIASLNAGGAERVIANLANCFSKRGNDVSIILFYDGVHYPLLPEIHLHVISEKHSGLSYLYYATKQLNEILKRNSPEVVVSFLTEINILSILASLGQKWKLIVSERNNPVVMPKNKAYRVLRKICYPFAKNFVFQTKQAKLYFSNTIQKKSVIIHNPIVQTNMIHKVSNQGEFRIVSVGRLEPQKNYELLIKSFAELYEKYQDCRLTIYGEGKLRKNLQRLVDDFSLSDVVNLPGNKQNVTDLIASESIFVLSSDYEGMSNALMEAMSVGLPCISTDCPIGGSSELIEDHKNGILVPVGDKEKMVTAMIELHNNMELRKKLSMNARKIMDTHSVDSITDQWQSVMQ